jgi:hypothetical protein
MRISSVRDAITTLIHILVVEDIQISWFVRPVSWEFHFNSPEGRDQLFNLVIYRWLDYSRPFPESLHIVSPYTYTVVLGLFVARIMANSLQDLLMEVGGLGANVCFSISLSSYSGDMYVLTLRYLTIARDSILDGNEPLWTAGLWLFYSWWWSGVLGQTSGLSVQILDWTSRYRQAVPSGHSQPLGKRQTSGLSIHILDWTSLDIARLFHRDTVSPVTRIALARSCSGPRTQHPGLPGVLRRFETALLYPRHNPYIGYHLGTAVT